MEKVIRFNSEQQEPGYEFRFTYVNTGEPLGDDGEGIAEEPKVIVQAQKRDGDGAQLIVASARLLAGLRYRYAPFADKEINLSPQDTFVLKDWVLKQLTGPASTRISGPHPSDQTAAAAQSLVERVSIYRSGAARFAKLHGAGGFETQILLADVDQRLSRSRPQLQSGARAPANSTAWPRLRRQLQLAADRGSIKS